MEITIYKSQDYEKFTFYDKNRPVKETHKDRVKESLKVLNLTTITALICTPDLQILDGQHRFVACQELDIPFHYLITEEDPRMVMELLNGVQSNWGFADHMKFHDHLPNVNFALKMFKKYNISPNTFKETFAKLDTRTSRTIADIIKKGFRLLYDYNTIEEYCEFAFETYSNLPINPTYQKRLMKGRWFCELFKFYNCTCVNREELQKKLWEYHHLIGPIRSGFLVRKTIAEIYNFRRGSATRLEINAQFLPQGLPRTEPDYAQTLEETA